jgi:hypothetical protein
VKSVNIRVSFMSQVSPNGRYVVTMINDPGAKQTGPGMRPQERIYVANFLRISDSGRCSIRRAACSPAIST